MLEQLEASLRPALPIAVEVGEVGLMVEQPERWVTAERFPLRGASGRARRGHR